VKGRTRGDRIRDGAFLNYGRSADTVDEIDHLMFKIRRLWWHHKKFCVSCIVIFFVALFALIGGWTSDGVASIERGEKAATLGTYMYRGSVHNLKGPVKVAENMLFKKEEYPK